MSLDASNLATLRDVVVESLNTALELDRSKSLDHDYRISAFEQAMGAIVRLECAVPHFEQLADSMDEFRRVVAELVIENGRTLAYYLMNAQDRAESVVIDG